MNLSDITTKGWILALFVRDDGERLLLGDGWFDFKDSLQHFQANTIANDVVELQGIDGQLLAGQVQRSGAQNFDGYVGDNTISQTEIEKRRRQFLQFFQIRRFYKVVYIFPDGTAIDRKRGYLVEAPTIPEMWQKFPEYHVALNFENANYYEYAENAEGDEIFANTSMVKLANIMSGGLVWDEDGAVTYGYIWLDPKTATGDYIMVNDGATGSPLTLSQLKGNTEQTTYSGKNLLSPTPYRTGAGYYNASASADMSPASSANVATSVSGDKVSIVCTATWVGAMFIVEVQEGQSYHLHYHQKGTGARSTTYTLDSSYAVVRNTGNAANDDYTRDGNITVESGEKYIAIGIGCGNPASTITVEQLQVELGSSYTGWQEYVGGTPAPNPQFPMPISTVTGEQVASVVGKNLCTGLNSGYYDISSKTLIDTTSIRFKGFKVVVGSGTYTLSCNTKINVVRAFTDYDSSSNVVFSGIQTNVNSFTMNVTQATTLYLSFRRNDNTDWLATDLIQLELGSTATTYEPYQGQSYTIDLDSIELAKIGTYQDRIYKDEGKWYIEKQVGKVVYDGSSDETIGVQTYSPNYRFQVVNQELRDNLPLYSGATTPLGFSNYFTGSYQGTVANANLATSYLFCPHSTPTIFFTMLGEAGITTTADFRTWLSTHPTTVYYALATPTTTEITDETLLSQLNFVASLYEGVNNISLVGTGAQGTMTVQYYADVDTTQAGYEWEEGAGGGATNITVQGIANAQPIWTVTGPAINPTLTNVTTGQSITWTGTVPSGQKLVIDMDEQTAKLSGANVYANISGTWIELKPGTNRLTYVAGGGAEAPSKIEWNGVVG